jgi:hypothetical protein
VRPTHRMPKRIHGDCFTSSVHAPKSDSLFLGPPIEPPPYYSSSLATRLHRRRSTRHPRRRPPQQGPEFCRSGVVTSLPGRALVFAARCFRGKTKRRPAV